MEVVRYEIDRSHLFFEQISLLTSFLAGHVGTINLVKVLEFGHINGISPGLHDLPTLHTGTLTLNAKDKRGSTKIEIASWLLYLSGQSHELPSKVVFETTFGATNVQKDEQTIGTMQDPFHLDSKLASNALGTSYEMIKDKIFEVYESMDEWPPELHFFRHARNACFHDNRFDIRQRGKKPAIDSTNPPQWRSYSIKDISVNGSRFMSDFFPYQLTLPFLAEIGELLQQRRERLL